MLLRFVISNPQGPRVIPIYGIALYENFRPDYYRNPQISDRFTTSKTEILSTLDDFSNYDQTLRGLVEV